MSTDSPAAPHRTITGHLADGLYANPLLLWLVLLLTVAGGLAALGQLPRLEDPHITQRNAQIRTLLPGATAARVETLVTEPLEELLQEIDEIKTIESDSRNNFSLILIELDDTIGAGRNTDVFAEIRAKLRDADSILPANATSPVLDDKRGAIAFGAIVSVTWRSGDADEELGTLARMAQRLGDRMRRLPGTELVRYFGAPQEEVYVLVDPAAVAAAGLTVNDLSRRIAGADGKGAAGRLRNAARELPLELAGELDSVARIERIPLRADDGAGLLTVGDVADVRRGWRHPVEDVALHDGRRTVLVAARPVVTQRVDIWGARVRETIEAFAAESGSQFDVELIFDQSRYVEERLNGLTGNLLAGIAVVLAIVLLIMGLRAALIIGLSLPLSAAVTMLGLAVFGLQLHQMTVFGLLVAIGLLIDSAIVVTDDVQRRLSLHGKRDRAAGEAVDHLFSPLWTSTFTTVLGFMPIFLLKGNTGDFVGPIAVSVIIALLASFAFSVTLIPVLAARYLDARAEGTRIALAEPSWRSWLRHGVELNRAGRLYRHLLRSLFTRPRLTALATLSVALSGFLAASQLGLEFFPPADRDQFEIEVWMSPDTALASTLETASAIEAQVREEAGIRQIDWRIGGSFPVVYYNLVMRRDATPYYAHAIVSARDAPAAERLVPLLQRRLDSSFPHARIVVSDFGQGPPVEAPVGFRLIGPSTDMLARYGEQIRQAMHEVPGLLHSSASVRGGQPKLRLAVDEYTAALSGLTLTEVAGQLQSSLEGQLGGTVLEDTQSLPVRVRVPDTARATAGEIVDLRLLPQDGAARGGWIPATALGEITLVPEKAAVTRRNGMRVNNIFGYTADGVLPIEVTNAIFQRLEEQGFSLPPGYRLEIAGDSEEQQEAVGSLAAYAPVLGLIMATTIILAFSSLRLGALIGVVAILCVGLGMLCLYLAGYPLGFNPLIGSAGLIGVAINGSIVVLAGLRENPRARRGDVPAMVEVLANSTRHLVATSLTTTAGFGPLLLSGGSFWPPLAIVIAGGVALSLLLSIGFTPACYRLLYHRGEESRQDTPAPAPPAGYEIAGVSP